ncbi:hypothetical protein PYV00_11970, partial [Novosphingobium sp. H3SJ31-1]
HQQWPAFTPPRWLGIRPPLTHHHLDDVPTDVFRRLIHEHGLDETKAVCAFRVPDEEGPGSLGQGASGTVNNAI